MAPRMSGVVASGGSSMYWFIGAVVPATVDHLREPAGAAGVAPGQAVVALARRDRLAVEVVQVERAAAATGHRLGGRALSW